MLNPSFFISGNSFRSLVRAFHISIDNKDDEIFRLLNSFLNTQLSVSIESNNEASYESFSSLFPTLYDYSLSKLKTSVTYREIYDIVVETIVRGIKDKVGYGFKLTFKDQTTKEDKQRFNKYSKILLNKFAEIINICLRNKDLGKLPFILNQLNQVPDFNNHKTEDLKFEILHKKARAASKEELEEIKFLQESYEIESFNNDTIRLLFKVSLYWSFFLYERDILSFEEVNKIIQIYNEYGHYIQKDFVDDLLKLRVLRYESDFSWGRWDYIERMDGVVYTPPDVSSWATFGTLIYAIKNKGEINVQIENKSPSEINSHEYLISSMNQILKNLQEKGYEKFGELLGFSNSVDYNNRIEYLRNSLTKLGDDTRLNKEKQISQIPIDAEYVENFKRIMCEGWEKANSLRAIFTHFENIVTLDEDEKGEEFKKIGFKNQILIGYKTTLIKNDDYYIPMFGIERTGENLASIEENTFFSTILPKESPSTEDVFNEIDTAIGLIENSTFKPTIILVGLDSWYNNFSESKNKDFIFSWDDNETNKFPDYGGEYKNIPIVKFRSPLLQNFIIVADFAASFELRQKEINGAFKNILKNEINEISEEEANDLLAKIPEIWKQGLTDDAALISLMNSIKVDFYLEEKFLIKEKKAFSIFTLK